MRHETIVCLGGGPSLTPADVDFCREKARVLAIKDSIRLAPWADWLYACDHKWWQHYGDTVNFSGPKYGLEEASAPWAQILRQTGPLGLELDPTGLRTGRCSGYQAINLAVHLGAKKIVLLGYDMQPGPKGERNWFGPRPPSYWLALPAWDVSITQCWASIVDPLKALSVEVINATRSTALHVFPQQSLEEALA
jgi:hypothetical protein